MRKSDIINALTDISDAYILESVSEVKPIHRINRRTGLLIAAALMALMLVSCGVYGVFAATSEVRTDKFPDITVSERADVMNDLTTDAYFAHYTGLLNEHGIAEEDVVVRAYNEYIRNGYYFDEMVVVTKDIAIGRIITDAVNFDFNVEFIGFFYNESKDEFKTVTQTTTAQGGKIEIVMDAEKGWECLGGSLGRNHPECEYSAFNGVYAQKYGHPASVRAMQFYDKYYDERIANSTSQRSRGADVTVFYHSTLPDGAFDPIESDDPTDRMTHIATACGIEDIPEGEVYYDKQALENGQYVEAGYVYDANRLIAFMNSTIESEDDYELFYISGIFYNQRTDRYMVIQRNYSFRGKSIVFDFESKYGWECIGVTMLRSTPETESTFSKTSDALTPVAGDEADSYEFFDKVCDERDATMRFILNTDSMIK